MILQKNVPGKFASKLFGNRYQIMEAAFYDDVYYVFDHKKDDNICEKGGTTLYFNSFKAAKCFVEGR